MKHVGLALGSGGARGYAHIGVIKILQKNKIPIDYVSGTSMGAVIGAFYALNLDVEKIEKVSLEFRKLDILKNLVDINKPHESLLKGKRIRKFLEKYFGDKTFDDTKIPLLIGATNLADGSQVIFNKGKIVDAVIASASIPGILPPFEYKNNLLIDGGVAEGLPVRLVKKMGAKIVIGVDLYSVPDSKVKNNQAFHVLERTYNLLLSKLSVYQESEYNGKIVVLRPDTGKGFQMFSFDKAEQNIKIGEEEAKKHLKEIKAMLK
ncbi:patatin-like phospholipase family protein [archaeon]|jgi:NTE family protein|nr:patatin-like phospholipase family protein [archaeon]MBT4022693.1 patatin-like phospholipase family protein [archaeon]MBT4273113.1 patatin-like phospholipase family protein [archaeon]MBT4461094.1 patatin-like phospholipase family protein [archaeon]MBT4858763.1 patatin-like phospholipase family protein [archaeon]